MKLLNINEEKVEARGGKAKARGQQLNMYLVLMLVCMSLMERIHLVRFAKVTCL